MCIFHQFFLSSFPAFFLLATFSASAAPIDEKPVNQPVVIPYIPAAADTNPESMIAVFDKNVKKSIKLSVEAQQLYGDMLREELAKAKITALPSQFVVVVDRNSLVQTALIYWVEKRAADSANLTAMLIGAAPVATGSSGRFDHYITPTGVFPHSLDNPDYRAQGTKNENGIMGYGKKGMRVFDFGWQTATKAWSKPEPRQIRFQMHATDPRVLETRLGAPGSKGCVRIPSDLNAFIDHYGILDADYEAAAASGSKIWILKKDREPTPWSGRLLVVVDSDVKTRPEWLGKTNK